MTKKEERKQLWKDIDAFYAKGGVATQTKAKAPRKGELLNEFSAWARAGRWAVGGVKSTYDNRYSANNTI